jgi:hypothetical protein
MTIYSPSGTSLIPIPDTVILFNIPSIQVTQLEKGTDYSHLVLNNSMEQGPSWETITNGSSFVEFVGSFS